MAWTHTITPDHPFGTPTGGMHTRTWALRRVGFQSTMLSMRPLSMCPVRPTTPCHKPRIGMMSRPQDDLLAPNSMESIGRTPCLLWSRAVSMGVGLGERDSCPR